MALPVIADALSDRTRESAHPKGRVAGPSTSAPARRLWRALYPDNVRIHAQRGRAWAKANPDYWRRWRRDHPGYYQRDLARRRKAYREARSSANETAIAEISRQKLTVKAKKRVSQK